MPVNIIKFKKYISPYKHAHVIADAVLEPIDVAVNIDLIFTFLRFFVLSGSKIGETLTSSVDCSARRCSTIQDQGSSRAQAQRQ